MKPDQDVPERVQNQSYRGVPRKSYKWIVLGVLLVVVLGFAALRVLTPLVFGIFIYYGTRPIFNRLTKRGISENWAATVSLLAVGLPALVVTGMVLIIALRQAFVLASSGSLAEFAPILQQLGVYEGLQKLQFTSVPQFLGSEGFREVVMGSWGALSSFTNTMVVFLLSAVLAFIFAFFMFGWGPRARKELVRLFEDSQVADYFFQELDRDLSTVFFGNMVNAMATGIVGAVVYSVINVFAPPNVAVPVPILLGFLTGIAGLIPLVGSKIVYVPISLLLVFESATLGVPAGYGFALIFFVSTAILVDTLPDMVLRPLISGKSTSQGALFLSYVVGPLVFGPVGIFLMPIVVVTFINFRETVLPGFRNS